MPKAKLQIQPSIAPEGQRLDIWLYRTRHFKTRGLAARSVSKGKIRITRHGQTERTRKSHTLIRPGDSLTFMRGEQLIHIEILAAAARRGPAKEAQSLYRIVPKDTSL